MAEEGEAWSEEDLDIPNHLKVEILPSGCKLAVITKLWEEESEEEEETATEDEATDDEDKDVEKEEAEEEMAGAKSIEVNNVTKGAVVNILREFIQDKTGEELKENQKFNIFDLVKWGEEKMPHCFLPEGTVQVLMDSQDIFSRGGDIGEYRWIHDMTAANRAVEALKKEQERESMAKKNEDSTNKPSPPPLPTTRRVLRPRNHKPVPADYREPLPTNSSQDKGSERAEEARVSSTSFEGADTPSAR